MGFCTKCGNCLADDSIFCDKCGAKRNLTQTIETQMPYQQQYPQAPCQQYIPNGNGNVWFNEGYNNRHFSGLILTALFSVLILPVVLIIIEPYVIDYILEADGLLEAYPFDEYYDKIILFASILNAVIMTVVTMVNCFRVRDNRMTITPQGVYGVAIPRVGFGTASYNLSFHEIQYLKCNKYAVFIDTASKKYTCFVNEPERACTILKSLCNK